MRDRMSGGSFQARAGGGGAFTASPPSLEDDAGVDSNPLCRLGHRRDEGLNKLSQGEQFPGFAEQSEFSGIVTSREEVHW